MTIVTDKNSNEDELHDIEPSVEEGSDLNDAVTKNRRTRPKLDIKFLKNSNNDDGIDKMWKFYLQVAKTFPTLKEKFPESQQQTRDTSASHLNDLLCCIRHWIHTEIPGGLSVRMFGEAMESLGSLNELYDYRMDLISRYKSDTNSDPLFKKDSNLPQQDMQHKLKESQNLNTISMESDHLSEIKKKQLLLKEKRLKILRNRKK